MGVQTHEAGFKKCLELLSDPLVDTPTMPNNVIQAIKNCNHFTENQTLVSLLMPIIDSISSLEHTETTLSEIWKELLIAHKTIQKVNFYSCFEAFKRHCLETLESQKVDHNDVYVMSMLWPFFFTLNTAVLLSQKNIPFQRSLK
ncbi:hypothetical protein PTTG_04737 [Puccinia triticina 1-1 BBBD Race 1]|uniref:Uncharacterized protein n=1 Tax=Puccinia triticina (isolate 1-1 / race 1 (BBBD)) TaxID=630390 RepID=A0A180G8E1_PUCT1|nr:hypothetical protein PTTG_04737 [Puccinia triticina 1-1 BBBD Race 1]